MLITILSVILGSLLGVFYGFTLIRVISYKGKVPHIWVGLNAFGRIILLAMIFFTILNYTVLNLIVIGTIMLLFLWLTIYKYMPSAKI